MASLPTTGTIDRPKAWGYEASIDDLLIRLARGPDRPLVVVSAPKQAERIQTEQTSEDFLPEFGQSFSRNNFTGGAGLDFAHRTSAGPNDNTRFWDSSGIDISVTQPGELQSIRLLSDTESVYAETGTNLHMVTLPDGKLIYAEGSQVWRLDTPTAAIPPGRTQEDPDGTGTQNVLGLAVLGDEVYAALNTDTIAKRSGAGSWSVLASAPTSVGVWAAKGRIFTDDGAGDFAEIDLSTGAKTTAITLDAGISVNAAIEAGPVVLVAVSDGTVYSLRDNTGTLELAGQTSITSTDVVVAMAWSSGVLGLATQDGSIGRIWTAAVGDSQSDFLVTNSQLRWEFASEVPSVAFASRDSIYFGVREDASEVALWRIQLSTNAIVRDLVFAAATAGDPVGIAQTDNTVFLTVAANGLLRQASALVDTGWIITPAADFFTPAIKQWVGLTLQADSIGAGTSIDVYISNNVSALLDPDSGFWQLASRVSVESQLDDELTLDAITGRYLAIQLRLNADASNLFSPEVISIAARAYIDSDDVIVRMPVNVSDWIEVPNRRPFRSAGWGDRVYSALLGFEGQLIELELFKPSMSIRGIIEAVETPIVAVGERGSSTMFSMVQVRGQIIGSGTTGALATAGSLGVASLGVQTLGA